MEKYKYTFRNRNHIIDTVEAQTLDEAMKLAGVPQYVVEYQFLGGAIVRPPSTLNKHLALGVVWEVVWEEMPLQITGTCQDRTWELKKEPRGYIFRRQDNPQYGFTGHHVSPEKAIESFVSLDGVITK